MIRFYQNLSTKFSELVNKIKLATPRKTKTSLQLSLFLKNKPCHLCDEETQSNPFFCHDCELDLPRIMTKCTICSLPLTMERLEEATPILVCGECLSTPPSFTQTLCPFRYELPIKQIIRQIKYTKQRYWITSLSWSLSQEYFKTSNNSTSPKPELLIPIPIHKSKRRKRGFNQAELIAKTLSKTTGIPFSTQSLIKTKNTETQAQLNKLERMKNLSGSFCISKKAVQQGVLIGRHIALIDDVMTTKATCELASKLLLENGAKQVDVWCLARTAKNR